MAEADQPGFAHDKELGSSAEASNFSNSTTDSLDLPEAQDDTPEKTKQQEETVLACLQVLGAFFCMFNSW
jgi:hypothetical protein